jgi:hypothetical protein
MYLLVLKTQIELEHLAINVWIFKQILNAVYVFIRFVQHKIVFAVRLF